MDFEITIGNETAIFGQYNDMRSFADERMAHWNNFTPNEPLTIQLRKVPDNGNTLGVSIEERVDVGEVLS